MAPMLRLLLIRHGATSAVRTAAFARAEPLEPAARSAATALKGGLPSRHIALTGPEPACRETAACLGLDAAAVPELAGCDMGAWRGMTLDQLQSEDPAGLMAWLADPDAAPHGGETLSQCAARVAAWMNAAAATATGFMVVIADAGPIKAAVCTALEAPPSTFWRLDVAPLGVTELHARDGRWTLRHFNAPLGGCRNTAPGARSLGA
jgi:broad specificity phosphatase PhoE